LQPGAASLTDNFHQMRNLLDHAADGGRIGPFDHLIQPGETQSFDNSLVLYGRADRRPNQFDLDGTVR
jgi:hypothetical protein